MKKENTKNKLLNIDFQNYFIISHLSKYDRILNYNLPPECIGMSNLSEKLSIDHNENEEDYKIKLYSYSYNPKKIKEPKTEIILYGYGSESFSGYISFSPNIDNFIYDFSFELYKGKLKDISPPKSLNLSKNKQFDIFKQYLNRTQETNIKKEQLLSSLLDSSLCYIRDSEYYYFDFYLSLLLNLNYKIIEVLSLFNLDKIKLPEKLDVQKYSNSLNKIKNSTNIITKYLNDDNKEIEKNLEIFYSILLYFRINYEKDKVNDLFKVNSVTKYYIKILKSNNKYWGNTPPLSNSFVDEILNNSEILDIPKLYMILNYLQKLDKILIFLNENSDIIYNKINGENDNNEEDENENEEEEEDKKIDNKIKEKIKLIKIIKISNDDNLEKISNEIERLLENDKILQYIDIGQNFWEIYSKYFSKKNLNALIKIKDIIKNIIKKKKELIKNNDFIFHFIHETGLDMSIQYKFKNNLDLLKFIKEEDIYYISDKYKISRNIEIFKGLKLSEIDENDKEFFCLWYSIKFIDIFDHEQYNNIQEIIISNAETIQDFHILFKLFNYYDKKLFNDKTITLLRNQYIKITQNFSYNYDENFNKDFISDSSLLIYLLDIKINFGINFIKEDFINKLPISFINKVFLKILEIYKDLSEKLIVEIANYFTSNENFKVTNFIPIIDNLKNNKCLEFILNKIDKIIIKKEMIFNHKDSDELKILKEFKKVKLFENKDFEYTTYIMQTTTICKEIIDDFKNNNLNYNDLINLNFMNLEKEMRNKLELININNNVSDIDISNIINKLQNFVNKIYSKKKFLDKCIIINNTFFSIPKQREIEELKLLYNKIIKGNIDEIEKNQSKLEEYENMFTNEYIDDMLILSSSYFFTGIFSYYRKKNDNEEGAYNTFEEAFKDYIVLKKLFDGLTNSNIDKKILDICLNSVGDNENRIYSEIFILQNYFKLKVAPNKFEQIASNLIVYKKKQKIINVINGIILFLNQTNAYITEFSKNLKNIKDSLLSEKLDFNLINQNQKFLMNYQLLVVNNPNNEKSDDYLDIFIDFYLKKEAFNFLLNLKEEDCRHLYELINLSDNSFLNISDNQDMEKCLKFLKDIKGNETIEDKILIKNFIKKAKEDKSIKLHFNCYFNNYSQIKELKEEKFNKTESFKIKLKKVYTYSVFNLSIDDINIKEITKKTGINDTYVYFSGNYYYMFDKKDNKKESKNIFKEISFEELLELRDIAMLDKNLGTEKEKEINNYNIRFSQHVKNIVSIFNILNQIATKGYQDKISIKISIQKNKASFYLNKNNNNIKLKDLFKYLDDIFTQITNTQENTYKNNETELIRFLYGRQFYFLNTCLEDNKLEFTVPLLNYILNNKYQVIIEEFKYNERNLNNINLENQIYFNYFNNVIFNCNNFLLEVLEKNKLEIKDIYKENIINNQYSFKGLYNYFSFEIEIEEQILNWYYLLTNNLPLASSLLICNKDTSIEEITSFLYRAILCQYNVLFLIAKVEELQPEKYEILSRLIVKLYTYKEKHMNSCLVFIYSNNNSEIVKYILKTDYFEILKHENKKKNLSEGIIEAKEVEIIYSDFSGVGKSTKIKNDIYKNGKKYIYFPLGGEFNKYEVIERLKKLELYSKNKEKIAFHIDLFDTQKIDLMREFLFSILITKLYSFNEDIIYLNKEIEIKIELPFGFIDFFSKFPLLKLFKNKTKISIKELPKLIVPKNIISDIQIVCNYLRLFKNKKIISNDLYIEKISSKKQIEFPSKIEPEIISDKECEELIFEYLNIEFPNYYQIQNFIKILSGQFKKFSQINSLSAHILNKLGTNFGISNLNNNRYIIIENIIKNSKFFYESSFQKLLKSQKISFNIHNNIFGEFDENKQKLLEIEILSKQNEIISYSNIKSPIIFFHEGIHPYYTILSPYLPESEEYKNLVYLQNIHKIVENIPDDKEQQNKIIKELVNLDLKKINMEIHTENQFIKNLISKKIIKKSLNKYEEYKPQQFYPELKLILDLVNPIDKKDKNLYNSNNSNYTISEIVGYYVITADNFLKMLLILLRIRENIPIIMMGETGCGKTSLIRKLYQLMNDGEDNMKILNIHSGITNKEIIDFLFKKNNKKMSIVEEAIELYNIEEQKKNEYLDKGEIYKTKKIWVFLDEINTCNCLGLISELMCKHSCNGTSLPNNIVFIGACNPYRLSKISKVDGLNFKKEENSSSKLVYTVNPLPHCLLNYVINFGSLSPQDEKKYIVNIIKEPIENYYLQALEKNNGEEIKSFSFFSIFETILGLMSKNKIIKRNHDINDLSEKKKKEFININETASKSIIKAQEFVRNLYDVSAVSLREIRRFSILYDYFVKYLFKKKETSFENYKKLKDYDIFKYSVILSVYISYYFHIKEKKDRKNFCKIMNELFLKSFNLSFNVIIKMEKNNIIDNIKIPQGIAQNESLLNNLFALFICITAKIPLFIIGKPGCSKSLSFQLLFKSMKGENSENTFFKNLPKIICNNYQGSLTSSSKGIQKIFDKARNILKNIDKKDLDKIISMIYFDEMGLAEHSPNNPLKILHSNLELDFGDEKNKISFVGISNWKLDAAKMNRGIFLSIPEPDEQDLKETAIIIANSYSGNLTSRNKDLYDNLSITYYKYKSELNKYFEKHKKDFHGARDFYHLIKIVAKDINKYPTGNIDNNELQNIAINSLERNFSGLKFNDKNEETSLEKVKKIYLDNFHGVSPKYEIFEKIKDNINSLNNRYLLLITNSSISEHIIKSYLLDNNNKRFQDIIFYIGSKFIQDQNSEEYILKILNKIQLQMEKNIIFIMKDLEQIYPSLYDLFNQNFTVVGEKNYARLSVGYTNNTFSLVNDWFKSIVFIDEKKVCQQEPPFLNRFEKHIINFEYLLSEEKIEFSKTFLRIIESIKELQFFNKKELSYDISKLLINCHKEEIQGLVFYYSKLNKSEEDITDIILEKIALLLPQDIILLMHYSDKKNKYKNEYQKILEYYEEEEHTNLVNYLKIMENKKNIIYTFSNILDTLVLKSEDGNDIFIENTMLGDLTNENIKIVNVNSIKSENELEIILDNIYDNIYDNQIIKLIIFKFGPKDIKHINYMKCFIEEKEKHNLVNQTIAFIFIVYIERTFMEETEVNNINTNKDLKENNIYLNEYSINQINKNNDFNENISLLSEYYQIFIDNLNGINQNIVKLIRQKNHKNLMNICLVNLEKILNQNIYNILSYFTYNFKYKIKETNINNNNYTKYILEYFSQDKILKSIILRELANLNAINKNDDIIKNIIINFSIKLNTIDYISLIDDYFIDQITIYLNQFVFKSENNNFLSSFLQYIKKNNLTKRNLLNNKYFLITVENFFEDINIDNKTKFIMKPGYNNVTILLGIQIPGIQNIIEKDLIRSTNDLKLFEKYFDEENEIRFEICEDNDSYLKVIDKINKILEKYETNFFNILKSIPLFIKIINEIENTKNENDTNKDKDIFEEEVKQYFNAFLDDYLLIFLSNNFDLSNSKMVETNLIKSFIKLIKILLEKRFNDFNEYISPIKFIKNISKYILWIQSNSRYIIKILIIYQKLSFIQELMTKIIILIKKNEIKYECDTKRSAPNTKQVNECFFLLTESLIKTILNENNLFDRVFLENDKIYNFILSIKEVYHIAYTIDFELNLFSKELPNIKTFIEIEEIFHEKNLDNEESIKNLIDLILKINKFNKTNNNLKKEEIEEISKKIRNLYEFLYSNIGTHKKFSKLINNIFLREIQKIEDKNYRKILLEMILNNKNILKDSIHIFKIIFHNDILENSSIDNLKNGNKNLQKNNPCYKIIDDNLNSSSENYKIIEQILLHLFESYFLVFFDSIKDLEKSELKEYYKEYYQSKKNNITLILVDFSLNLLKEKFSLLENINNMKENKTKNIENSNIIKLYCIAFIKIYLSKAIDFIYNRTEEFNSKDDVMNAIIGDKKENNLKDIIKIYILKLLNSFGNNYVDLQNFKFKKYNLDFFSEFKEELLEKKNKILNYYMLPSDKLFQKYKECLDILNLSINEKFIGKTEKFEKFIIEDNIDIFYSAVVNEIISNLHFETNIYNKFCFFCKNLFNNKNFDDNFINLIFLFLDENNFNSIIRPKILLKREESNILINYELLEILLYGMRFCLQTCYNPKSNNLYSNLIKDNCLENINKYYLPGIDEPNDLKVINYYLLENHFENKPSDYGAYVCSCGTYYEIPPCGFPIESYNCINCKKLIGGQKKEKEEEGYHKMIKREGHFRIFKNIEEKTKEFNRFNDNDLLIPNMLLSDYKKKIIDPILLNSCMGIPKINKIYFLQKNKKIRNLSQVGYRLLNFILYSHLFYSYCINNFSEINNNMLSIESMNYIQILKSNWELLKNELFEKGVIAIQIFLNLIFEKLSALLKSCPEITNDKQREQFEGSIEKLLEENYKEYEKYSKIYLETNMKLQNSNKESIKSIILELYNPDLYDKNKYPFLQYFIMTKYPNEENFINEFYKIPNYENKYPLINSYISTNK